MSNIYAERLEWLRAAMRHEGVDALIIPTADYHSSEYVAPCFRLRAHYSGFTGSAGTMVVFAGREARRGGNGAFPASAKSEDESADADFGCADALLWTDGRYYIQAERELEGSGITLMRSGEPGVPSMNEYLASNLPTGAVLAFDGRCMTAAEGQELQHALGRRGVRIRADLDPAGECWEDRPPLPSHPVWILDAQKYAGETVESKLTRLRARMAERGATAFVSGKLDEIMWLYNLRGNDVICNPVALSYTVVTEHAALLYLQESEVTDEVRIYLKKLNVELHPYEDFLSDLADMRLQKETCCTCRQTDGECGKAEGPGPESVDTRVPMVSYSGNGPTDGFDLLQESSAESASGAQTALCGAGEVASGADAAGCDVGDEAPIAVWIDPDSTSYAVYETVRGNILRVLNLPADLPRRYADADVAEHLIESMSPLTAMKAVRNETEIRNFKSCYLEDSAVLTRFIYWLKHQIASGAQITEAQAAAKLDGMRSEIADYVELSFGTISAYGSNAAMMHYDYGMSGDGGALLRAEGMYLVDSGGHYLRGTTDVTRTIALGPVTDEMRRDYTLTAVSQLRMMETVFLKGCNGMSLDIMAREPMWRHGMDYKCGTGHGIGYLLNVHEGPQNLRWRARGASDAAPFETGMVISDEPGVYKTGRSWNAGASGGVGTADASSGTETKDSSRGEVRPMEAEGYYGIRIETILITKEWGTTPDGEFLCFEPLTFVPLDPDLIDPSFLAPDARDALNRYHAQVLEKLAPFMNGEELGWLRAQCAKIGMTR